MMIRFRFERGRELKYLAHLDMMTLFERTLRRADIRTVYSEGFNKRPRLIFGIPISTGMLSVSEYADIMTEGEIDAEEFMRRMNDNLPAGARVTEASPIEGKRNIMNAAAFARYIMAVESSDDVGAAVEKLMNEKEVYVEKDKKGTRTAKEIRKGIISARYADGAIELFVTAGQNGNIKPEEFISALKRHISIDVIDMIRTGIYVRDDTGQPVSPFDGRAI